MTLSRDIIDRVTRALGRDATAVSTTELDGGHVGRVYRLDFAERNPVVVKVGETPLDVEAAMLDSLSRAGLPVPQVYVADSDFLVLEYVEGTSTLDERAQRDLAAQLAALHETTAPAFGFPFDTLSGPYRQPNPWTDSWVEFFRDQRLLPWCEAAMSAGLPTSTADRIDAVASDLDFLLTEPSAPRLVHGDVWPANLRVRDGRVVAFLDPACYYAHPEVELAYIDWVDGAGDAFFDAYDERRPLDPGFFEERAPVYALFPLLEHVRVFGSEYVPAVRDVLDELGY
ncbi:MULTISPECIES: fructosamine kinase family protein [Haloferax]|uniref:Phosphotransferase n=2 Tax=Haloferax TaxID=2251 RepID=A0A6G1Z562_9EURY|nr:MULTISPECIES: fructosamine kinase family protein [Haloferax]KAB1188920.1 fructosamine kinase family protein [Haloferax sp. CBA1149]MRW81643.1 phosphotransferase [Haloferax marinisediminis]